MKHLLSSEQSRLSQQSLYNRLLQGDLGSFFDTTNRSNSPALFPQLESLLKTKKASWNNALPLCTNYGQAIARIISDFAIGEGVRFSCQEVSPLTQKFFDFIQEQNLNQVLTQNLLQTVATGLSGVKINGSLLESLSFQNIFEQENGDIILCYLLASSEDKTQQAYTICYAKTEEGYTAQHQVWGYNTKNNTLQDLLDVGDHTLFEGTDLDENGFEPQIYTHIPLSLLKSPYKDQHNNNKSLFQDIIGHIQTLAFLETSANTELETHFLSKMAVPRSMVQTKSNGTPYIESHEYMAFEDGGELPTYIQKDNKFFADLRAHIKTIKQDIALLTGIPVELFDKEQGGSNEKVDISRMRRKPFLQLITSYQRILKLHIQNIAKAFFAQHNAPMPQLEIILPKINNHTSIQERSLLLQEYQAGLTSKEQWAKSAHPSLTNEEIKNMVEAK